MKNSTEIRDLENLTELAQSIQSTPVEIKKWAEIEVSKNTKNETLPLVSISFGSQDPKAPCLILTAGVHGLERVGSHVCIQHLLPFIEQLKWNSHLQDLLKKVRLTAIPIVNPGGMYLGFRSNPNGVDIMRNAAIEGKEKGLPLVSGHRKGAWLPWYRGAENAPLETETDTLLKIVQKNVSESAFAISLDIHSGFGMRDRIWYPWSHSKEPIPDLSTIDHIEKIFKKTHPYHFYQIEPQTSSYVIHGDPWDWLYDWHLKIRQKNQIYIPLALEMGSWTWLRKNPGQFFRRDGIYNPIIPHRYNRIMRRHRPLLDFLLQIVAHHSQWNHHHKESLK